MVTHLLIDHAIHLTSAGYGILETVDSQVGYHGTYLPTDSFPANRRIIIPCGSLFIR